MGPQVSLVNIFGYRPSCVIFFAVGGGGDAATAAALAASFSAVDGVRVVLASNAWERFVRDPNPGPIPLNCFVGVEPVHPHAARVGVGCRAFRPPAVLEPAVCRAARAARVPSYIVDLWAGSVGAAQALEAIASLHGCEAVVAVDVGGDVLARGCEEELWSPLADSVGLAATVETGLDAVLAVHSPGADGELPASLVLRYISEVAAAGGYLWARGLSRYELGLWEQVVEAVHTEAGRIALLAARGYHGGYAIRMGTRRVEVGIVNALTFFLDARRAARYSLARIVAGSGSLWEARERLNMLGVYTELDLEEDLSLKGGGKPDPSLLGLVRLEGRRRVRPCRASSVLAAGW